MPYRAVKQYSDRGSLKDLVNREIEEPPTTYELRLRDLYDQSLLDKNSGLSDSVGFIVMPGSSNRSEYPVSIYRHREYISSLSDKLSSKIEDMKQELALCFVPTISSAFELRMSHAKQQNSLRTILQDTNVIVKMASSTNRRSFRRVS